jgi:hypothetical protein
MRKHRLYRRYLTEKEKKNLRTRYVDRIEKTQPGCFERQTRQRILNLKFGERAASKGQQQEYEAQFWNDVKYKARGSFVDMQMLSEVADETLLKQVFLDHDKRDGEPFISLIRNLFSPVSTGLLQKEEEWRKDLLLDIVLFSLKSIINGKTFKEPPVQRLLVEALNTLAVKRHGNIRYEPRSDYGDIVVEQLPTFMPSDVVRDVGEDDIRRNKKK